MAGLGMAGEAWRCGVWLGSVLQGMAGRANRSRASPGKVRYGAAWQAVHGGERQGKAWLAGVDGVDGSGMVRNGAVWPA